MKGINKVIAIGYIGAEPVKRGGALNMRMAVNEQWFDKKTQTKQERTEWLDLVAFGKLAEICEKYVRKGDPIYVEGKIQTSKYQGKDGQDKYSTSVVCTDVQFLGTMGGKKSPSNETAQFPSDNSVPQAYEDFDDDIPF